MEKSLFPKRSDKSQERGLYAKGIKRTPAWLEQRITRAVLSEVALVVKAR